MQTKEIDIWSQVGIRTTEFYISSGHSCSFLIRNSVGIGLLSYFCMLIIYCLPVFVFTCFETQAFLSKSFDMKDMGDAKYVLGIKIDRDRSIGRLSLSHRAYIDKVLKKYGMDKCAPGEVLVTKGDVFCSSVSQKSDREGSSKSK